VAKESSCRQSCCDWIKNRQRSKAVTVRSVIALSRVACSHRPNAVSGFWDSMYREARCRQPVNMTPYLLLKRDLQRQDPAQRAALLLHGLARHRQMILKGTLDIDRDRGRPMDMRQYEMLYGHARIPGPSFVRVRASFDLLHWRQSLVVTKW
jgi:hypothetical protein